MKTGFDYLDVLRDLLQSRKIIVSTISTDMQKIVFLRVEKEKMIVYSTACIKVFSGQICKKVHRLLYHSLCTDVAEGAGFDLPCGAGRVAALERPRRSIHSRSRSNPIWVCKMTGSPDG